MANSGSNIFDVSSFKPVCIKGPQIDPVTRQPFQTQIVYDTLNRPISQSVEYKTKTFATTTSVYDKVGNVIQSTDPLGNTTQTTYDGLNRPTLVIHPDHTATRSFYTLTGFKWKTVDELRRATETQYDAAGRPSRLFLLPV